MKVVHICTSLTGGAGLCAKRIIDATSKLGVENYVLVRDGEKTAYQDSIAYPWSRFWPIQKLQVLLNMYHLWPKTEMYNKKIHKLCSALDYHPQCFTMPFSPYDKFADHPWVREADVIHLQWVGGFLDYESFFSKVKKPIVWTIHDENPGLGGFHYTSWRDAAPEEFLKYEKEFVEIKRMAYANAKNLTLVAISTIMADFFKRNDLLRDFPIVKIHNGIEDGNIQYCSKIEARKKLGLGTDETIFLFVAQNIHEDRKGLKELIVALELLAIPNARLLCIGGFKEIPVTKVNVTCVGFISDYNRQCLYYSAADYFAMPSFQESFGQTPLEAMTCGTPVVAFPCGIIPELINDENGVVCDDFTVDALRKGIETAMGRSYDSEAIRADVVKRFSYDKIGREYVELYEEVSPLHLPRKIL